MSIASFLLIAGAVIGLFQPAPDLVVTIQDVRGTGVAGITVLARDASGAQTLAETTTNALGQAVVASLPARAVRVVVDGRLLSGAVVYLPDRDRLGIAVRLGAPPAQLNLRVEPDGLVRPDPTMLAPDRTAPVSPPWTARPVPARIVNTPLFSGDGSGPGMILVAVLVAASSIVIVLTRRWRQR